MSGVQEKIIRVLRENGNTPMKAIDIAKKVDPSHTKSNLSMTKKSVNQVIFEMVETEKAVPVEQPPKWRLKDKHMAPGPQEQGVAASRYGHEVPKLDCAVATPTNYNQEPYMTHLQETPQNERTGTTKHEEVSPRPRDNVSVIDHILEILKFKQGGVSGAVIAKALGMQSLNDVTPLLCELEKRGLIKAVGKDSDSKPLWELTNKSPMPAQNDGRTNQKTSADSNEVLYKKSDLPSGIIQFTPHSHTKPDSTPSVGGPVHYPMQETPSSPCTTTSSSSSSRQDEDVNVPAPIQETLSNIPHRPSTSDVERILNPPMDALNSTSQGACAPFTTSSAVKRKIKIAANFNSSSQLPPPVENSAGNSLQSGNVGLRSRVLQLLNTGKSFSALELSKVLESNTDLTEEITDVLVSLSEEGLVEAVRGEGGEAGREGGVRVWRLK